MSRVVSNEEAAQNAVLEADGHTAIARQCQTKDY